MNEKKELTTSGTSSRDKRNKAILGTLTGPCADIINPTRNGRKYDEALWDNVFSSDLVKEQIAAGGVLGELGHPADRSETDPTMVAICMSSLPEKNKDGLLMGKWDILDTPNGRILKTLVDYGYKIGISSRGTGDVVEDIDGGEHVDESTYDFQAFDAVIIPAVKAARLSPVVESIGNKTLKQALNEALETSSMSDKATMEKTLTNLNIDYSLGNTDPIDNKELEVKPSNTIEEAVDNRSDKVIKDLQESLKVKASLEDNVLKLQNQLAVSDTKVMKLEEDLNRYKSVSINLSNKLSQFKQLKNDNNCLKEELKSKTRLCNIQDQKISRLIENRNYNMNTSKSLNESISNKDKEIVRLNENLKKQQEESNIEILKLKENLENLRINSKIKYDEYAQKIKQESQLKEGYKKLSNSTVSKYIEYRATMLGISKNEITNKLGESYSLKDIDDICDDLQDYQVNVNSLPFTMGKKAKVTVTESKKELVDIRNGMDDEIDDSLVRLAKIKR